MEWWYSLLCACGTLCFAYVVYSVIRFALAVRNFATVEFKAQPSIKSDPRYQDPDLLAKAAQLPVARRYLRGQWQNVVFQPREGYCGHASVYTVLLSLSDSEPKMGPSVPVVSFPMFPRPFVVDNLAVLLEQELRARAIPFRDVAVIRHVDCSSTSCSALTLEEFRQRLRETNDPHYRFIANFLRSPLFYCDSGNGMQFRKLFGGHFSPIAGYLEDEDLALVLDVNRKFGFWLVPAPRLYEACCARDFSSGRARGLIRVALDSVHQ